MQDDDEDAFRERYTAFIAELRDLTSEFDTVLAVEQENGSSAESLNAYIRHGLSLADAIDRVSNVGARSTFEKAIRDIAKSIADELVRTRPTKMQHKLDRMAILAIAYEKNLIAADILGDAKLPVKPGMASAYVIAGQIGHHLPHLSPQAVEQLRFRMAREAQKTESGKFVSFDSETLTFSEAGGPILDTLRSLPKKRGRPKH